MNYRNHPISTTIVFLGSFALLVHLSNLPTTPAWAMAIAPYVALVALLYAAAYGAARALEFIAESFLGGIASALMVLDQKGPRDDTSNEVCVELDDANQTLELRQKLRMPSALPVLDTTRKDWRA